MKRAIIPNISYMAATGSDSATFPCHTHTALPGCAHLRRNVAVLAFRYALRHADENEMRAACCCRCLAGKSRDLADFLPSRSLPFLAAVEQEVEKEMKQSVEMRAVRC